MTNLLSNYLEDKLEAGCDEAGRGCMAGPVVCASVILPPDFNPDFLNDSKKLSEAKRKKLRPIIEQEALAWNVQIIAPEIIDEINILNASIFGMQEAVRNLQIEPEHILVDGNRFHPMHIPHTCIIKGDGKYKSIAAASILAKTYRDEYMEQLHELFPAYNWKKNKGYPTFEHRVAMETIGSTEHHRKSFILKASTQLKLPLE